MGGASNMHEMRNAYNILV